MTNVELSGNVSLVNQIHVTVSSLITAFGGRSQVCWRAMGSALAGQTNSRELLYGYTTTRRAKRETERFSRDFRVIQRGHIRQIASIALHALWDDLSPEEEAIAIEEVVKGFVNSDFFIIE